MAYEKNELTFAIIWIVVYCGLQSLYCGRMLDAMFAETAGSVPLLLCVVLCGFASMNFMTAPSISMEGISLWLLQSLPIDTWKIDDSGLT